MFAGGSSGNITSVEYEDIILEYDTATDSMIPVGRMTQGRSGHALSVVNTEDFSQWCN